MEMLALVTSLGAGAAAIDGDCASDAAASAPPAPVPVAAAAAASAFFQSSPLRSGVPRSCSIGTCCQPPE
eukprot:CAMPEP_0206573118 /NCGR_PEP_ID=MMETSP0325_2-20121206/28657_1 /ASSEMBLY_ACC=CAM_ASM_000347 /TAXON_ID=2866 /ORGANISM="Crypthecodinium cohnii, Strain Seligo" /LENGTH=69 /DNA_ID=CAMNT_0054077465 /DNA_START=985 /DNA_END=1194 /DNA_ORIENTATION=-